MALEERKWDDEFSLRKAELESKASERSFLSRLISPVTATILAGILTVAGSVTATLLQNNYSLSLEHDKQQHELIIKMITVEDVDQAKKNLNFLAQAKLITDPELAKRLLEVKETPLISRPEASQASSTSLPELTDEDVKRLVSEDARNTMILAEVGDQAHFNSAPHLVGEQGGLVIGIGYDLGFSTTEQFKMDWSAYLSQSDLEQLSKAVGLRGDDAKLLASKLPPIFVDWDDAVAVFTSTLARWATILERNVPNVRELPPDAYGALLSLVYNRGTPFKSAGPRFAEMRQIWALMDKKDFAAIPEQLRSMERLWPNLPMLVARREKEAQLFEKGLAELMPPARM